MRGPVVALPLLALALSACVAPAGTGPPPPNVLVILTDDQHPGTVRGYMPNVERRFIAEGVEVPAMFATIPLCCPSRAGILTGLYGHNNMVKGTLDGPLLPEDITLQAFLRQAGYRTGFYGKLLNNYPLDRGLHHVDDYAYMPEGKYLNPQMNINGAVERIEGHTTTFIHERALDFLRAAEADDGRPWFLYLAVYAPHSPWLVEEAHRDAAVAPWPGNPAVEEADLSDKPPFIQANQPQARAPSTPALWTALPENPATLVEVRSNLPIPVEAYLRTLVGVDAMVGEVFDVLDDLGEADDTLAFFASDHGHTLGEHGWWNKMVAYDPSLRVPFFLRWPSGGVAAGGVDPRLASLADLLPTVLDAAGINPAGVDADGRSLLNLSWERDMVWSEWFSGSSAAPGPEGWLGNVYSPLPGVPPWGSLRGKDFHYVEYYNVSNDVLADEDRVVVFREYYDLDADPWGLENLLGNVDPGDDPAAQVLTELADRARAAWTCRGTSGTAVANPCP